MSKAVKQPVTKKATEAYLTKRVTAVAAKRAFENAAKETLDIMGYNVVAKNGWVVKVDKSGNVIEKISQIAGHGKKGQIHLD